MAKVYVIMGNDYPSGVCATKELADLEVARRKASDNERWKREFPKNTPPFTNAGVVYWRWYEYELEDTRAVNSHEALVTAVQALGALPEGYCFCSSGRDASKDTHEPECRDLRAALAIAEGKT